MKVMQLRHLLASLLNYSLGTWRDVVPMPNISLEAAEERLQGEEKELFLTFLRKMLQWRPEDRKGIQDVFMDEWLLDDLIKAGEVVREQ